MEREKDKFKKNNRSIKGIVTLAPILKTSRQGKSYANFCVVDDKNNIINCRSFGEVAVEAASKIVANGAISINGYIDENGTCVVTSYFLPATREAISRKIYRPKIEKSEIEEIMDVLGDSYVNKEVWTWFRANFPKDAGLGSLMRDFPQASWRQFKDRLRAEAGMPLLGCEEESF